MDPVLITLVDSPGHNDPYHAENLGRFGQFDRWQKSTLASSLKPVEASPASLEDLARVHTPALLSFLSQASQRAGNEPVVIDPAPTYVTGGSWQAAMQAAGGGLALVRAVLQGPERRAFALIRPPGHHADAGHSRGFCLLNNLAIGVADALAHGLERAAVIDFDAHHGNGTQAILWNEPRVGFFSCHQEGIYPGSGALNEAPHARGRLINLPLPANAGDAAFEGMAGGVIEPWLEKFKPQMLFVSAGFDAHWQDPFTSLGVSTEGYFHLARRLIALAEKHCQGKIAFYLEGGYNPAALADNVWAVLAALAGETDLPAPSSGRSPYREPDISSRLATLRQLHGLD